MRLVSLFIFCFPIFLYGQGCGYGGNLDDLSKVCDYVQKANSFSTNMDAEKALDRILNVTGMSKRYVLEPCNDIDNCIATAYKGVRYILYDRDFMKEIANNTNSWSKLSILAHEIGHHVNGHSLDLVLYATGATDAPSLSQKRQTELEADEYSGFVMYKLGATLSQAQAAINKYASDRDDTYSTHPAKSKRLEAIERGYNLAKGISSKTISRSEKSTIKIVVEPPPKPTAEDYFYKAKNSNDFKIKIKNYTLALDASTTNNSITDYDLNSDRSWLYFQRGWCYQKNNQPEEAIKDFTKAINLDPDDAAAYLQRGLVYGDLNEISKEIKDYNKVLELDKNEHYISRDKVYLNIAGTHYTADNYTKAIEYYNKVLKLDSKNTYALLFKAKSYYYMDEGADSKALKVIEKAIKIDPYDGNYLYWRGVIFQELGEYKKALDDYNKAMKLASSSDSTLLIDCFFSRAENFEELGEEEKALEDYTKAIKLASSSDYEFLLDIYESRGIIYGKSNREKLAIDDFSKCIELDPDHAWAYKNRGWAYYNLNKLNLASDDMRKAIEINPSDSDLYGMLGYILKALGKDYCDEFKKSCDLGNEHGCNGYNKYCK